MKKTAFAAVAIGVALVLVLAASVALLNQPSQTGSASGTLAVMGTDPPMAPQGTSAASAHYSSVQAHKSGSDMSSGWTQVSGSGTLNLMASGQAQVMAVSKVNAATYDAFRFNVDSVSVVYQGQNYTTAVASSTITAASQSKVQVNSTSNATALVDMRTLIQNAGTASSPQFIFTASAYATAVPPEASASLSLQVGVNVDLSSQAWFSAFESQTTAKVNIVSATLSSGFLSVDLQNSGGASGQVQEIIVTPLSSSVSLSTFLPATYAGSAVFTVSGTSSLQQSSSLQAAALSSAGATVASGSSSTLNYSGNIAMNGSVQSSSIVSGEQYVVTCIGANTYASTTVVAS